MIINILLSVLLLYSLNLKSKDLEDGYYYFILDEQFTTCHHSFYHILNKDKSLDGNVNLVVIPFLGLSISEIERYFPSTNIIIDSNNILLSKYGIESIPSLVKINNNEIDKGFNYPLFNSKTNNVHYSIKKTNFSERLYYIQDFKIYNNNYYFIDKYARKVVFKEKDEIRSINLIDIIENIYNSKSVEQQKYLNEDKLLNISEDEILGFSNKDSLSFYINIIDSFYVNNNSFTPIDNIYEIDLDINNSISKIQKFDVNIINKNKIEFESDSINLLGYKINKKLVNFDEQDMNEYEVKCFKQDSNIVLIYYQRKIKNNEIRLHNKSIQIIMINTNSNKTKKISPIMPYKLDDKTLRIFPVDFDGKRIKYFLYHTIEGWIEIDQYLDFEF